MKTATTEQDEDCKIDAVAEQELPGAPQVYAGKKKKKKSIMGHHVNLFIVRAKAPGLGKLRGQHRSFHAMPAPNAPRLLFVSLDNPASQEEDEETREHGTLLFVQEMATVVKDTVAYIETDYWGGVGTQTACVSDEHGKIIFPWTTRDNVVNTILRGFFGVVANGGMDEWDTVGLGKIRSNYEVLDYGSNNPSILLVPAWPIQRLFYIAIRKPDPESPLSTLPRDLIKNIFQFASTRTHSPYSYCGCVTCGNVGVRLRKNNC